jgi:hypothetical protein
MFNEGIPRGSSDMGKKQPLTHSRETIEALDRLLFEVALQSQMIRTLAWDARAKVLEANRYGFICNVRRDLLNTFDKDTATHLQRLFRRLNEAKGEIGRFLNENTKSSWDS